MKKLLIAISALFIIILFSCSGGGDNKSGANESAASSENVATDDKSSYDPKRGEGKFKDVDIPEALDNAMAMEGEKVHAVKCSGCHKLTDERLVGPGFTGVTSRHTAEWIMNFVTNTDEMIDKDPKAQALLEICLVRMPNQNLTDENARNVYEYLRKNDGVK